MSCSRTKQIRGASPRCRVPSGKVGSLGAAHRSLAQRTVIMESVPARWPAEAEIVREMFRLSTEENLGHKSVSDRLNAMGYISRTERPFAAYTIQHILTNPALAGRWSTGRPRRWQASPSSSSQR